MLAELVGDDDALELGVGSGRVALPLAQKCRNVWGIDTSPWMLTELKKQDSQSRVVTVQTSAVDFDLEKKDFQLIFFISWGLAILLSDREKEACFQQVSKHLKPSGLFVVETIHPEGYPFSSGNISTLKIDCASVILGGEIHKPADRIVLNNMLFIEDNKKPRVHTSASHYCATADLDEMARRQGLELVAAYSDWTKNPLQDSHASMIRVYRKS
nr:class I SAM-dependent methyltransferase [Mobiluncus mulieris]